MRYIILKIILIAASVLTVICLGFGVLQHDLLFVGISILLAFMTGLIYLQSRQMHNNPFLK